LAFMGDELPSMRELFEASLMPVWDQDGVRVPFGRLFDEQRTIVIFIRHFWCPMCQDYMASIVQQLDTKLVDEAGVKLVVIGCGDPAMIKSYNTKILKSPFELYTDPFLKLHSALGMTLKTLDGGPEAERGEYIKHGALVGTLNVIGRAVVHMPPHVIVRKGGDIKQLGGEFVMGPGLRCGYAHRMGNTRNHASIRRVAEQAGVIFPHPPAPLVDPQPMPSDEAPMPNDEAPTMDAPEGGSLLLTLDGERRKSEATTNSGGTNSFRTASMCMDPSCCEAYGRDGPPAVVCSVEA